MTQDIAIDELADRAAAALSDTGWCIIDDAILRTLAEDLAHRCGDQDFRPAGTGRRRDYHRDTSVRSDAIRWLDPVASAIDARYLMLMDALRAALNRRLFLGLFDYECHYARYEPDAFYSRHLDAFAGERNRVLSTVLYLNTDWQKEEGGELLLYGSHATEPFESILPQFNRLVLFLSERFPHEVKPATRVRHSIAGWFRLRAAARIPE